MRWLTQVFLFTARRLRHEYVPWEESISKSFLLKGARPCPWVRDCLIIILNVITPNNLSQISSLLEFDIASKNSLTIEGKSLGDKLFFAKNKQPALYQ